MPPVETGRDMAMKRTNGEGSVRYDAARDRYRGRLRWTDTDGAAHTRDVYGRTAADAVAALRKLGATIDAGQAPVNGRRTRGVTVRDFVKTYTEEIGPLAVASNTLAAHTLDGQERHLRNYVVKTIGDVRIDAVALAHVRKVMVYVNEYRQANGRELGTSSKRQILISLRVLMDAAIVERLATRNPARDVKLAKAAHVKGEPHALDAADISKLLAVCTMPADRALILTYLGTGARRAEIVDLTWDRVDLENGVIRIGDAKTPNGEGRPIPIPSVVVDALTSWRRDQIVGRLAASSWTDNNLVFPNRVGTRRDLRWVTRHTTKLLNAAGLTGSTHTLRHTYGSRAVNVPNAALGDVAANMGQSVATLVGFYVHGSTAGQRHAADGIGALLG